MPNFEEKNFEEFMKNLEIKEAQRKAEFLQREAQREAELKKADENVDALYRKFKEASPKEMVGLKLQVEKAMEEREELHNQFMSQLEKEVKLVKAKLTPEAAEAMAKPQPVDVAPSPSPIDPTFEEWKDMPNINVGAFERISQFFDRLKKDFGFNMIFETISPVKRSFTSDPTHIDFGMRTLKGQQWSGVGCTLSDDPEKNKKVLKGVFSGLGENDNIKITSLSDPKHLDQIILAAKEQKPARPIEITPDALRKFDSGMQNQLQEAIKKYNEGIRAVVEEKADQSVSPSTPRHGKP